MKDRSRSEFRVAQPVRTFAQRFAYFGLVMAAFALMLLGKADTVLVEKVRTQVTDAVAPILDVMSRPMNALDRASAELKEMSAIRVENAHLREERARLLHWEAAARKLEAENNRLRELLQFQPSPEATYISARVIADAGGAFAHSLILNAGAQAGVRKGQAVVAGAGLVGRVQHVGERSARILLITDLNSRLPVLVESNRTRAILAGDNTENPRLIHLPPGGGISAGDRIVTSGHGGAFPPGLPVGVVTAVNDGLVTVQPFVDRDRLEVVRVLDFGLKGILELEQGSAPRTRGAAKRAQ